MPASTLTHVKLTPVAVAAATPADVMTSLNTLLTQVNDWASNPIAKPLTVGTEGTAAVYWSYFEGKPWMRGICAGDGVTVPTYRSPDTALATDMVVGVAKGSIGAYGTWATSPVWAGSTFSDYWKVGAPVIGTLRGWYSGESLWVTLENASGVVQWGFATGALLDAHTVTAPAGESDSTLSGMTTFRGSAGEFVTTSAAATHGWFDHGTTNAQKHAFVWDGGSVATSELMQREFVMAAVGANVRKNRNGDIAAQLLTTRISSGTYQDRFLGRVRECYYTVSAQHGQTLQISGVDYGHFVGRSSASVLSCFLLKAA